MPSLKRIVLINTHLPGVVELALDGHTNICGTNASGKTTLQRLVPVFYGEYPSRVVPSTRDSFERWYLPHDSSYIIYEYQKQDGLLYQAVLASAGDGKGVNYRFIAQGFTLEDFVKSRNGDTIICHSMADLGREMKRQKVAHSNLLNTREFRAIIQNDRSLLATGSNRSELRTYARQFSLCEGEHSLRHIEKLAKAVHSKEGKMETVKSMIAAILEEDGVNPPASRLNPQRVESWIRESQLVQGFEEIRPQYDKLAQEFDQLLSAELRLASLTKGYKNDETREVERQEANLQQASVLNSQLADLDSEWKEIRDELNQEISAANASVQSCEQELDAIEAKHAGFLDANIEQAKADLDSLPNWRSDVESLQQRHQLQTEKHQDVEAAYNARRSKIGEQLARELDKLHQEQDSQREQRDAKRELSNDDMTQLEQQWRDQTQTGKARFSEQEYQLKLTKVELKHQIDGVTYTEDEKTRLAIFDERIARADEEQEVCNQKVERLTADERKQRAKRDQANEALRMASIRVNEASQAKDELHTMLFPQSHTLLEFLRKEAPGWEQSFGKVVAPELLHRTDLHPSASQAQTDTLFGIHLDLNNLDVPEYAQSEQDLRIALAKAEDVLKTAQEHQQDAESQLVNMNDALDKLSRELTVARTTYKNSREDLRRLFEEKRTEQQSINAALTTRKAESTKRLTQLDNELKQLHNQHQQWLEEQQAQALEARMEKSAYWQEVLGVIDNQLGQIKANIAQRRQHAKTEQKACETWYKDELKSRGVDEDKIIALKKQIRTLEAKISSAEQRRSDVLRFDDWYQHAWLSRKPKLQTQLANVKQAALSLEQQLTQKSTEVKTRRNGLETQRKTCHSEQVSASENLTKLREVLRKLAELTLPRNAEQASGSIGERLRQGEELLLKRDHLLSSVKQYVQHFDSVISSKSGSNLAEFWERAREESSYVNDKAMRVVDYRKLVPQLERLLNELVPQSLMAIKEQGRNFGIQLNSFYDVLAGIDRRIATQSARITREVGEELFLDGVSESAVKIRSRITELEFWPELRDFVKAFKAWKADNFTQLPDENYTNSMRRALDIIGRAALTGGVAKLLEIELRLKEGNSDLVIRTDRQLNESSSHGMAYLILCKFLLAFTRLLRGKADVTIHWPIDELGTLHHANVKKIFDACENNNISVLGAFPNPESEVLSLFTNRYIINKQTKKLQVVKPKANPLAQRIAQHKQSQHGEQA
ncbi:ATP-binding protein [Shewanella intestini]|uniref:ATP-binding protein n=1 Tax=Shewanella intestini TaxID=2017544 RepID=A0ABS5I2U9_9GAMM|nr:MULTISPECIES: ATP-binding protein [Shewanella]MBR9728351.1 ATP-binding protein [Shewanella intestini]MRG36693.1 ATP-binding protein [Shewanella sp. XMDDZSB0408]